MTKNTLAGLDDYAPFQITNPLDGTPLTVYKLNAAKQGLVDLVDTTASNSDTARQTYTAYELDVNV